MKKLHLALPFALIVSILPIAILYLNYDKKQSKLAYQFRRNIQPVIKDLKVYDIAHNSFYIAGRAGNDIYLGNVTAKFLILKVNSSLTDTERIEIKTEKRDLAPEGNYRIYIDSNQFYMFNGFARSILWGKIPIWHAEKDPIFCPNFNQSVPMSSNSMAYRFISNVTKMNSFRKESMLETSITNEKVLEKQVDGLFCTDGILKYSAYTQQLVYVYFYRNQMLLLDTNLNLVKKVKTIDPIDSAKFKVSELKSRKASTFSSPNLLVNANYSTWKNYIFIQSKIMGLREDIEQFKNSSAIDVYDLEKHNYLYSFYLSNVNKAPIRDFEVYDDGIIALTGRLIVKYTIKLPTTK